METVNHEYYVSLEVAKLLKEAGFNWKCDKIHFCYIEDDHMWNLEDNDKQVNRVLKLDYCLLAPTLDVTQRWLREVKNIEVNVLCVYIGDDKKYSYTVFEGKYDHELIDEGFDTYEEAQESGIKKALEIILEKGE